MRELNFPALVHQQEFENLEKTNVDDEIVVIHSLSDVPPFSAPFSPHYGILTYVKKGWVKGRYNMRDIEVKAGDVCIVPQHSSIITMSGYSDDLDVTVILFTDSKTGQQMAHDRPVKYLIELFHNPIITPAPDVWPLVLDGINMLDNIAKKTDQPNRLELMRHTFNILFDMVCKPRLYKEKPNIVRTRAEHLFEAFVKEVQEHISESHKVSYYADRLFISPNYLLKVCQEVVQTSASELIDMFLVLEAQNMLLNRKDLTIQQISDQLGFPNQSFFARFFKEKVGLAPQQYRLQGQ